MTQGLGGDSPANIQNYLKGVNYPASKQDLVSRARQNGAPDNVVQNIQRLPTERFSGPQDIMKAFGENE